MFQFGALYEWTQLEQYSKDTISIYLFIELRKITSVASSNKPWYLDQKTAPGLWYEDTTSPRELAGFLKDNKG